MPTIKYSDNPNEETAFVTQDGGQRNRAVLTAAVSGTIKYPDNPNSTKVTVTVDGVEHKAVAVADISGGGGGGGGAVSSVNGKTGAVVLDAEDVGALPADTPIPEPGIPQYETMPTASASNTDEIAQYSGVTIPDVEASATIEQTIGSGLSDLSVDVSAFEATEQPDGEESVSFVASVTPEGLSVTSGTLSLSGAEITIDPDVFLQAEQTYNPGNFDYFEIIVNASLDLEITVYRPGGSSATDTVYAGSFGDWGITITGEAQEGDSFTTSYVQSTVDWERDGTSVNIYSYGVSYSGIASDGDELTVTYSPFVAGITNGYFYKSCVDYSEETVSVQQTTGSGLGVSINADTFIAKEQPTGDEQVEFLATVEAGTGFADTVEIGSSGKFAYFDTEKLVAFIAQYTDHTDYNYVSVRHTGEDTNRITIYMRGYVTDWHSSYKQISNISDSDLADYGITLSDYTYFFSDACRSYWAQSTVTWTRDDTPVILSEYGISISSWGGAVEDGDVLTVTYTARVPIKYYWSPIAVQNGAGGGGIDWVLEVDLPSGWSYPNPNTQPIYCIEGGLPDGTYEYYFQVMNSVDGSSTYFISPTTYKVLFTKSGLNINGNIGYVVNGDFMPDDNKVPNGESVTYNGMFRGYNGDLLICHTDGDIFGSDIPSYFDPVPEVKGCFKITTIKNVDTGDEYTPTNYALYNGSNLPWGTTYYTNLKLYPLCRTPYVPAYHSNAYLNVDDTSEVIIAGASISVPTQPSQTSEIDIVLQTTSGGLFHLVIENTYKSYLARLLEASGDLENVQIKYQPSGELAAILNLPTSTEELLTVFIGHKGSRIEPGAYLGDASSYTNTLLMTYIGGTIEDSNYGTILQYTGATNGSYTNGYFYKADGTVVPVAEAIEARDYTQSDFEVTFDADDLIDAMASATGQSRESVVAIAFGSGFQWSISYDADNQTVTSLQLGWWHTFTEASVLQYVSVSTILSGTVACSFYVDYTPAHNDIQNPAWTRVDVQPAGSSLPSQTGQGGKFLITDGTDASWSTTISQPLSVVNTNLSNQTLVTLGNGNTTTRYFYIKPHFEAPLVDFGFGTDSYFTMTTTGFLPIQNNNISLGASAHVWTNVYTAKLNNGADIEVPTTGGTMVVATPPTTPNTSWVLKATVDANGDATVAWVQEV